MEITFFGTTLADMVSECALWQDCILQPFRWPTICSGPVVWTSAASPKRESPQTTGHLLQLTVRATADQQFASLTNHQLIQRCPTFSPWLFVSELCFPPCGLKKIIQKNPVFSFRCAYTGLPPPTLTPSTSKLIYFLLNYFQCIFFYSLTRLNSQRLGLLGKLWLYTNNQKQNLNVLAMYHSHIYYNICIFCIIVAF